MPLKSINLIIFEKLMDVFSLQVFFSRSILILLNVENKQKKKKKNEKKNAFYYF